MQKRRSNTQYDIRRFSIDLMACRTDRPAICARLILETSSWKPMETRTVNRASQSCGGLQTIPAEDDSGEFVQEGMPKGYKAHAFYRLG